jgi:phospholipase/carboxylesterase
MMASALVVLAAVSACEPKNSTPQPQPPSDHFSNMSPALDSPAITFPSALAERGLLSARPRAPSENASVATATTGTRIPLHLGDGRDGYLYVPAGVDPRVPTPLVVFFHGAGGRADQAEMIRPMADAKRVLVLSVDSRERTWDVIRDEIGPDVAFVDRALQWTFDRFTVDPAHVGVSGFSDGASYALTLGLANGEVFSRILAFSPGFAAAPELHGMPRVFVSHGTKDAVLPIAHCSRPLVKRLTRAGYHVDYHEFDGPHTVPAEMVREAFGWLLA